MKDEQTLCRRCQVPMLPGKALQNTLVGYPDFLGDTVESVCTVSETGPPVMVDCLKCPECGHSIHVGNK